MDNYSWWVGDGGLVQFWYVNFQWKKAQNSCLILNTRNWGSRCLCSTGKILLPAENCVTFLWVPALFFLRPSRRLKPEVILGYLFCWRYCFHQNDRQQKQDSAICLTAGFWHPLISGCLFGFRWLQRTVWQFVQEVPLLQTWCICLRCWLFCSVIQNLQTPAALLLLLSATSQYLRTKCSAGLHLSWNHHRPASRISWTQGQIAPAVLTWQLSPVTDPWADSRVQSRLRMPSCEVLPQHQHSICQHRAPTFCWFLLSWLVCFVGLFVFVFFSLWSLVNLRINPENTESHPIPKGLGSQEQPWSWGWGDGAVRSLTHHIPCQLRERLGLEHSLSARALSLPTMQMLFISHLSNNCWKQHNLLTQKS